MTNRLTIRFAALAAIFLIGGAACAAEDLPLKPGEYAVTITYQVENQRENQTRVVSHCIAHADLNDPEKIFSDGSSANESQQCSVSSLKISGGKISYDADCPNRLVHVEGSIGPTSFAVVRSVRPKTNQAVSLKLTLRGNRTRDCANSSARRF